MPRKTGTGNGVWGPVTCACCTQASLREFIDSERQEKFYFVAFVFFIYFLQFKSMYSPFGASLLELLTIVFAYTVCCFCCVGDFWRCFMGVISKLRLFSECFKIGKFAGLIACAKYLSGRLVLEDLTSKSSDFSVGAVYE